MPGNPIADDRGEFANLQRQATIVPRRHAQRIFVEPNLGAVIARVKAAIEPRLRKEINVRAGLCVEKERQTRIKKRVDAAVDEARRRLLEVIDFQIERAAQSHAQIIMKCRGGKRVVDLVEKIIDVKGAGCAGKDAQAESAQLHATPLTPSAAGKRT